MTETKNRLVVDTCGTIQFPDSYTGPGVILAGKQEAVAEAAKHFARGVVLLGCDDVEDLIDRIATVISDTHDIDVTDDNYGVAVACDLLGIDPAKVYADRRAKVAAE